MKKERKEDKLNAVETHEQILNFIEKLIKRLFNEHDIQKVVNK